MMKLRYQRFLILLSSLLLILSASPAAFAHGGRTDGNGGHRDKKNKSGLGSYHYHCGGHPAHLHPNGTCPYAGPVSPSFHQPDPAPDATVEIPVEQVTIQGLEKVRQSMEVGTSTPVQASVFPEDADIGELQWKSSDESVATISGGILKAHKEGSATITVLTQNGIADTIKITVREIPAQRIDLSYPETLSIGDTSRIEAAVYPENTSYPQIQWQTSDASVLTVDAEGNLKAQSVGIAAIHAIQKNMTASAQIEVLPIPVAYIEINHEPLEKDLGIQETLQFFGTAFPQNATYPDIFWSTSDETIAIIDQNGLLTTIASGEVTVYARTADGVEASVTLHVVNKLLPILAVGSGGTVVLGGAAALLMKKKR